MAYATVAQLEEFTGQPAPVDAGVLLERASEVVAAHITRGVEVDLAGLPTSPIDAVIALATCAQAAPGIGEAGEPSSQSSIDGVILSPGEAAEPDETAPVLAPRALLILRGAGLVGGSISTWG